MNANQKELQDLNTILDDKDVLKDLNSYTEKASANLNKLVILLDDIKKAQKNAQSINVANIFKEELDNLNDMIFDNFMELNTSIEGLINKHFTKEDPDVTKFMETEKVRFSKLQKDVAKTSAKLKEKSIQLEQLDKISQTILPQLIQSSRDLNALIKAVIAKLEAKFQSFKNRLSGLTALMENEAAKNKSQLEALRADLDAKSKDIDALRAEISKSGQQSENIEQGMKQLKQALDESEERARSLKTTLAGKEESLSELQRIITDKDGSICKLKQDLAEKGATFEEMKAALNQKEARVDDLQHAVDEKERVIDELKRGLEDSKELVQKAQQLGELKALCEKQAEELKELQEKLALLNQDMAAKDGKCQGLEREKDKVVSELGVEAHRSKELRILSDGQSAEIAKLKEKISGLDAELSTKSMIAEDLNRCNEKLRLLSKDAGKSTELRALLDKQSSELDAFKVRIDGLSKDLTGRDVIIGELQQKSESLETRVKKTDEAKIAAEKQVIEMKEILNKQATEIKSLNEQLAEMKDALVAKDVNIDDLKKVITTFKELASKPRPLDTPKESIKQKTDEIRASMAEKQDGEFKGKYEALQKEMKHLLKFLEKSPKQQLLFLVSNLGTTSLDKLVEVTKLDEGLVRKILDDLREENLIEITPDAADATKLSVKIVEKLNPIGYLDVKHAGFSLDFTSRPFEQVFESQLDLVKAYQELEPETAGFILAALYTHARERKNFTLLRQLGSLIEDLKPRSFYLRLVDNLFSANPGEAHIEAISNAYATMPRLITFDTASEELHETSEGYPKHAPFSIEKAWCISVIDEVERPDIGGKAHAFNTVTSLLNWAWLAAKGSKIKVAIKDATGKIFDVIVASGKPRNAEVLSKSFKNEAR